MRGWKVTAAATALAAAVFVAAQGEDAQATWAERCRATEAQSQLRQSQVTGAGARVAVIGDSWSQGYRLDAPQGSWPAQLPGRVWVDGFAGSGFSLTASPCAGVSYAERTAPALATDPDLVVVQGGLNDHDMPTEQVRAGANEVLAALAGRPVVLVGPAAAPRRAARAAVVDRVLAEVADDAGVPYVRTYDWELDYLPDRLHLTAAGHADFGRRVAAAIEALELL